MGSRKQPSKSALVELGPALAGLGSLLVGIAAIAALILSRPSEPAEKASLSAVGNAPSITTTASASGPGSRSPSPSVEAQPLADFAIQLRAIAAEVGVPTEPAEYRYVVEGPSGGLLAEVPTDWKDTGIFRWTDSPPNSPDGAAEEDLGTILIASPDEESIFKHPRDTYGLPLVILSGSRRLAREFPEGATLDSKNVTFRLDCDLKAEGRLAVREYEGPYEVYGECRGVKALLVAAELRTSAGDHLVGVNARIASLADISALERALFTMRIEVRNLAR